MAAINPKPIIFPLSNPVRLSECSFDEAVTNSNGTVLFASGSPFPAQRHSGRVLHPGQGNNMYIFPGLGLGAILARATQVTDSMVEASSLGLADSLTDDERAEDLLYPRVERSTFLLCYLLRSPDADAPIFQSVKLAPTSPSRSSGLLKRRVLLARRTSFPWRTLHCLPSSSERCGTPPSEDLIDSDNLPISSPFSLVCLTG
jgi:hypothetical protein